MTKLMMSWPHVIGRHTDYVWQNWARRIRLFVNKLFSQLYGDWDMPQIIMLEKAYFIRFSGPEIYTSEFPVCLGI